MGNYIAALQMQRLCENLLQENKHNIQSLLILIRGYGRFLDLLGKTDSPSKEDLYAILNESLDEFNNHKTAPNVT